MLEETQKIHTLKAYCISSGIAYKMVSKNRLSLLSELIYIRYSSKATCIDACMQAVGSAPKGDISMGMQVSVRIFPVSSKACL